MDTQLCQCKKITGTQSEVKFSCTPSYELGIMPGVVKDKSGGILLNTFEIDVAEKEITCTKDANEMDDSIDSAKLIISGQQKNYNICAINDKDWSYFDLSVPSSIHLETKGVVGDTVMTLYDSSLSNIVSFNDDKAFQSYFSEIKADCKAPLPVGRHYVKVESISLYTSHAIPSSPAI